MNESSVSLIAVVLVLAGIGGVVVYLHKSLSAARMRIAVESGPSLDMLQLAAIRGPGGKHKTVEFTVRDKSDNVLVLNVIVLKVTAVKDRGADNTATALWVIEAYADVGNPNYPKPTASSSVTITFNTDTRKGHLRFAPYVQV